MSSSSLVLKALETETGKFIANKFFSKLESTLKSNSNQREVDDILNQISPIDRKLQQSIFETVADRYLKFRTLLSRDNDVFIDEIYHPLKIKSLSSSNEIITLAENTTFTFKKIACIIGKAGQGKTTLLRKLYLNLLIDGYGNFPLLITLRRVNWEDGNISVPLLVSNEFHELGIDISIEASSYLLQLNRLHILYDGFDEIDSEYRRLALSLITQTYVKYGSKCVVTTRPGTEVHLYGAQIENYLLMDLELDDVNKIISNHSLISDSDKNQLFDVITTKPDIACILLTPIIVDIFISTYNSLVAEPTTIVDFYDELFQALVSSHDRLKVLFERKGKSGLNNKELEKVFWTASYSLLNKRNDTTFRQGELSKSFDHAALKHGFNAQNAHIDVIDKTSLIKQDGHDYSYLHKSIAEFHAAKHIKELSDNARIGYYEHILNNYRVSHENILRYLSKIDNELFYIVFVKSIIDKLTKITDIFDGNKGITSDVLLASFSYNKLSVTIVESTNNVSFRPNKELSRRDKTLLNLFLMLSSILDIELPKSNQELFLSAIKSKININKIRHLYPDPRQELDDDGNVFVSFYNLDITEILDLNSLFGKVILSSAVDYFYYQLFNLKDEVDRKEKIYTDRNALNQFY